MGIHPEDWEALRWPQGTALAATPFVQPKPCPQPPPDTCLPLISPLPARSPQAQGPQLPGGSAGPPGSPRPF